MTTSKPIIWSHADMIESTVDWWENPAIEDTDCNVIQTNDGENPCLVVLHTPTGRTSDEAGDRGRWHLNGTAFAEV